MQRPPERIFHEADRVNGWIRGKSEAPPWEKLGDCCGALIGLKMKVKQEFSSAVERLKRHDTLCELFVFVLLCSFWKPLHPLLKVKLVLSLLIMYVAFYFRTITYMCICLLCSWYKQNPQVRSNLKLIYGDSVCCRALLDSLYSIEVGLKTKMTWVLLSS